MRAILQQRKTLKMPTRSDLIPVKKFIAESRENLEIATAVHKHYEDAREIIVSDFFASVSKLLKARKRFLNWETAYDGGFFTEQFPSYRLFKKSWKKKYDIRIEAWQRGDRMIYGVWRNKELLGRVNRNSELFLAVRRKLPRARLKARDYFEAEIWMDSPEPDWRRPKALWRMAQDRRFALEVADLLSEMAELAEEHIDDLMH